ncbi:S66 family peptidase [Exiguobacterium flavidum]|uniref:S66 family peptidase n=1 Tax=Exiguobacterium flavidum TaxID=2184695 RepID=UPI000DF7A814|nr:S66 peptidase family protein [Exiguobacterium flavidum]
MRYPHLAWTGMTIGVTAPSSGVPEQLHPLMHEAAERLKARQLDVKFGETTWTEADVQSADGAVRAMELNQMFKDESIDAIIPPWGGERAIDVLDLIDYDSIEPKWLLGYSDTSTIQLAITLKTGIATAHGTNLADLRSEEWDPTTEAWRRVLATRSGGTVTQWPSEQYQSKWNHQERPERFLFHLDRPTEWKTLRQDVTELEGRLLGGCLETVRHLIGTPYGDVAAFRANHTGGEPILWYFEACEANAADIYRTIIHMHYAGWFDEASGILFGRTPAGKAVKDFDLLSAYAAIEQKTGLSIFYDLDIGHQPPQSTLVNGAFAKVVIAGEESRIDMTFR